MRKPTKAQLQLIEDGFKVSDSLGATLSMALVRGMTVTELRKQFAKQLQTKGKEHES